MQRVEQEQKSTGKMANWAGRLRPVLWQAAALGGGLALAGGGMLGGVYPLGLALALGAPRPLVCAAALGAALGGVLWQPGVVGARYALAAAAVLGLRVLVPRQFWPGALGGALALVGSAGLFGALGLGASLAALDALAEGTLAASLGWVLRRGGAPARWALAAAVVAALQSVGGALAVPPGLVLLGVLCLWAAQQDEMAPALPGLCLAGAAAAALPAQGVGALGLALGGALAARFAPGQKLAGGALFAGGCLLGALAGQNLPAAWPVLLAGAVALLVFWVVPARWAQRLFAGPLPTAELPPSPAGRQLHQLATALRGVGQTVEAVYRRAPRRPPGFELVVDSLADEVCRRCSLRHGCWQGQYQATRESFCKLEPLLRQTGGVLGEELPGQLAHCTRSDELRQAAARAYGQYRAQNAARTREAALRRALTEQYRLLGAELDKLAGAWDVARGLEAVRTRRLRALLEQLGWEVPECAVTLDKAGRMSARASLRGEELAEEARRALATEVSRVCGRPLILTPPVYSRGVVGLLFCERPLYTVRVGLAAHAACEGVSGDATSHFVDDAGCAHLLLCDGMGTGRAAALEGGLAVSLTARLLGAGFTAATAARLANTALAGQSEESGATLDAGEIDLYTGCCRLYKAGAAASFAVCKMRAERLEGGGLPLGVLEQVTALEQSLTLRENDWLVLVSDGVLTGGGAWLEKQLDLRVAGGQTPQQLAQGLADQALERQEPGVHPDDVTVLAAKLER